MSWLQTLLIASVPSLITAVALTWQNRQNNVRDEARRKDDANERDKDRQHSTRQAEQLRREALGDHWREERKQAHVALLASFQQAYDFLNSLTGMGIQATGLFDVEPDQEAETDFPGELSTSMRSQLATVQVLATTSTSAAAQAAFDAFNHAEIEAFMAEYARHSHTEDVFKDRVDRARYHLATAVSHRDDYLAAVREELGTTATA